jgi:hypothetical protein
MKPSEVRAYYYLIYNGFYFLECCGGSLFCERHHEICEQSETFQSQTYFCRKCQQQSCSWREGKRRSVTAVSPVFNGFRRSGRVKHERDSIQAMQCFAFHRQDVAKVAGAAAAMAFDQCTKSARSLVWPAA